MESSNEDQQHVETRNKNGVSTNIHDVKILNERDLKELDHSDHSSYEKEGKLVAVESVALVCFHPVLVTLQC